MNKLTLACSCGQKNCNHFVEIERDQEISGNAAIFFKSNAVNDPWLGFISVSKEDIKKLISFLQKL